MLLCGDCVEDLQLSLTMVGIESLLILLLIIRCLLDNQQLISSSKLSCDMGHICPRVRLYTRYCLTYRRVRSNDTND